MYAQKGSRMVIKVFPNGLINMCYTTRRRSVVGNVSLFDLILNVHSTIFQLCGTGLPGLKQY